MALKVCPPAETATDTPPKVVCKGNASEGLFAGPKLVPKIVKNEPWAMSPFGNPTLAKLAALTTARSATLGCAITREVLVIASREKQIICFIDLLTPLGHGFDYTDPGLAHNQDAGNLEKKDQSGFGFLLAWVTPVILEPTQVPAVDQPAPQDVTKLLSEWSRGDRAALEALMPLVYGELRRVAGHYLKHEKPGHTLSATALVHEAYLRLVQQKVPWQNRAHFFSVAAQMMRRILVDHARSHHYAKRGAGALTLTLDQAVATPERQEIDLLALDDALHSLAKLDERQSRRVELRFFGGLSIEETSEVLGVSAPTVKREWASARAWLYREISRGSIDA
jgi:RNA polymerase sigma-70 factor (ECF subfamily)